MGIFRRERPSTQEPPNASGVYRFINNEGGEVDYYGEAADLRRRSNEHFRSDMVSRDTHTFA